VYASRIFFVFFLSGNSDSQVAVPKEHAKNVQQILNSIFLVKIAPIFLDQCMQILNMTCTSRPSKYTLQHNFSNV